MAACNDLTKREAQVLIKRKFPPRSSGCETRSKGTFGRLYFWLGQVAEGEGRRARTSTGSVSTLSTLGCSRPLRNPYFFPFLSFLFTPAGLHFSVPAEWAPSWLPVSSPALRLTTAVLYPILSYDARAVASLRPR